jgi:hypothetical protein
MQAMTDVSEMAQKLMNSFEDAMAIMDCADTESAAYANLLSDKIPKQLFSRNGPVAVSPCKAMGQWQFTNPAKGKFASKKCSNLF